MDLRKGDPYVSCIKIRGVPIIPPLMTEDIRMEMRYYKHLALAVEERLKKLENLSRSESDLRLETITQNSVSTVEDSSNCEEDSDSHDKTLNAITVVDVSTEEASPLNNCTKTSKDNKDSEVYTREISQSRKFSSDEETSRRDENILGESASSDVITASTDINQYLNDSFKSDTIVSTLENSPETRKPEVPKTLDIVPIIVDATITNGTTHSGKDSEDFGNNMGITLDEELTKSTTTTTTTRTSSESDDTTPKLVRQGSYVLDSPSPMLLAHLEEEKKTISDNYVPSSSTACNSLKRKEWNISQAKSDWELQRRKEAFVVTDNLSRATPQITRVRRNSTSNATQARTNKFSTQTRTLGKHYDGTHEIARSADCIRSMLYRESTIKNTKSSSIAMINGHGKETTTTTTMRSNLTSSWKSTRSVSILSMANKLSGSLGSLTTAGSRSTKRTTTPQKQKTSVTPTSKSFDNGTPTRSENFRGSTQKLLSAVTSEKLVHVFKEIQNTHERQMIELIERQKTEQRAMQKEFEKQQILLLAQIEQTFPGICLPRLAKKIATPSSSPSLVRNDETTSSDRREKIVTLPKRTVINGSHSPEDRQIIKCPLDDIYPREELKNLTSKQTINAQSTMKKLVVEPPSPPIGLYSTSVLNGERKNYGVSRQLFPLEGRTKRLPVLNNVVYGEKHIKAATVINAYARGYLVRRMMQTERVIALKSTYGEALHCMLKLHVDAPLALPELNFHQRLQLQCDAASMNIVELFAQDPAKRMEIIKQDRQVKRARQERPNSARSCYSFATKRTLARKKLKEMGDFQTPMGSRCTTARARCQTWTSNPREKRSPSVINQGIKRSTSAGAVRKPWR